jgi:hypothetical protein
VSGDYPCPYWRVSALSLRRQATLLNALNALLQEGLSLWVNLGFVF